MTWPGFFGSKGSHVIILSARAATAVSEPSLEAVKSDLMYVHSGDRYEVRG